MKTNIINTRNLFLSILFLAILFSCVTKKTAIPEVVIEDTNPKLIFLNYTISKDENGGKRIQFIDKIVTNGRLKTSGAYHRKAAIGDLKCTQIDNKSTEIQSITIENPLSKIIEYVNDSLIFEKRKIDLNKAPLSLRLQLNSKTKYITISEIIDTLQTSKPLITTTLD